MVIIDDREKEEVIVSEFIGFCDDFHDQVRQKYSDTQRDNSL